MEVSQLHWLPFALLRQLLAEYVKEQGPGRRFLLSFRQLAVLDHQRRSL